jgi:hypothetical protein
MGADVYGMPQNIGVLTSEEIYPQDKQQKEPHPEASQCGDVSHLEAQLHCNQGWRIVGFEAWKSLNIAPPLLPSRTLPESSHRMNPRNLYPRIAPTLVFTSRTLTYYAKQRSHPSLPGYCKRQSGWLCQGTLVVDGPTT